MRNSVCAVPWHRLRHTYGVPSSIPIFARMLKGFGALAPTAALSAAECKRGAKNCFEKPQKLPTGQTFGVTYNPPTFGGSWFFSPAAKAAGAPFC